MQKLRSRVALIVFSITLLFFTLQYLHVHVLNQGHDDSYNSLVSLHTDPDAAQAFIDEPVVAPFKHKFWEVGSRSTQIREWIGLLEHEARGSDEILNVLKHVEKAAVSLFPFIPPSSDGLPLSSLFHLSEKGSKGIVMSVGGPDINIRFAGHLISALRQVLKCQLPLEITYAGEDDLPIRYREALASLDETGQISFVDMLTVFDDKTLRLRQNGWAIKPFSVLASRFEQVLLVDCDSVFLQDPESLFYQRPYVDNGAYLFHDRLLWQHAFKGRHEWFHDQIKEPSPALNKSLVWTEEYAEECDSGVVVLDKSRPDVFFGLLHTAWQNTYDVREEVTYKITYGDKESWWLGLELAGAAYKFEERYGSMLGWETKSASEDGKETAEVCSFVIAHTDPKGNLLWFNGSLLKNKLKEPDAYDVPDAWMMDGTWRKGATKQDMSCMVDAPSKRLSKEEHHILQRSMEEAMAVDALMKSVVVA
ncbi:glycosyltransferase family 71 protein [Emericellopsis atlantica]|uniref:Glycosyltransferase family 71 protein n=1 Tax=Emericellopsis atlantica TaxID=2614577 RepID=A0A9P7ZR14_9HYPO|nr:glycosyltransferase family 71 protein [Emericellopsis atlantica]KAG9256744.1 glycosyltransferase family 71 protein [Emericellopsis atlantica]